MIDKIYESIDTINNSNMINRLNELKEMINSNEEIKNKINNFYNAKDLYEKYNYKDNYLKAKLNLFDDPVIKEYLDIQNEINLISLYINNNIKDITKGTI